MMAESWQAVCYQSALEGNERFSGSQLLSSMANRHRLELWRSLCPAGYADDLPFWVNDSNEKWPKRAALENRRIR